MIESNALAGPSNTRRKWYLCGIKPFFSLCSTTFFLHFSPLFTTSHSSHMLKFMTSFRSHEIKSLGFIFFYLFFLCFTLISLCPPCVWIHFPSWLFSTLYLWYCFAIYFRLRFFSIIARAYSRRELSLLLLFILKRLPNTRPLVCTRFYYNFSKKYLDDFVQ